MSEQQPQTNTFASTVEAMATATLRHVAGHRAEESAAMVAQMAATNHRERTNENSTNKSE